MDRSSERVIRVMRVISRMNLGGPAWQSSVLTRRLSQPEFESVLLVGTVGEGEADFIALRDPKLPHRIVPGLGRSVSLLEDLRSFGHLVRQFQRFRPDVVHTHTAKAGVLGRLAAFVTRVPVRVHTFHGHLLHGYFGPNKTRILILIERLLAHITTAFVSVGGQVRDDLSAAGIGKPEMFTVIPPGVATKQPPGKDRARVELGVGESDRVALFVGRLTEIKRVDRLIEAFSLVVARHADALLIVVGAGELEFSLRNQAAHLNDRIIWAGWQSEPTPFYAAADVVVLTSDNEGMPVSLIEASMAGIPCVTTDVGSAREVVSDRETGFVVDLTPESVAHGLLALLEDPDLARQMGQRARERAELLFGAERLAEDHRRLYRRLMGRPDVGFRP